MAITPSTRQQAEAFGIYAKETYRLLELSFDEPNGEFASTIYFRICDQTTVQWNDLNWERMPFEVQGEGQSADTELARPQLFLPNDDRRFSYYAERGLLEGGFVTLYDVHPEELHTQQARVRNYVISRVTGDNEIQLTVELRSPSDGPNYKVPARRFMPPEFQTVNP
ncbi:hypothetical protein [Photobacterium sp. GSS17]|uniref:hypothetical protein n=1 Tax=Photobacterium sp. GSS17 TaxID=3020715 RepID=UPI002361661E|nr:hypothetical protein [Photobacterium sp. GSS17]